MYLLKKKITRRRYFNAMRNRFNQKVIKIMLALILATAFSLTTGSLKLSEPFCEKTGYAFAAEHISISIIFVAD